MTAPRRLLILLVAGLLPAGCGGGSSKGSGPAIPLEPQDTEPNKGTPGVQDATGGKIDIDIRERSFTPHVMHVKVGQIIVWTDDDDVGHTVRADRASLPHSGLIPVKGRFEFTPLKPGRIAYHCVIHPGMHGVVVVRPS